MGRNEVNFEFINTQFQQIVFKCLGDLRFKICGGREKVGKSNNLKNELTMFTP
jgi:hypothetical protein